MCATNIWARNKKKKQAWGKSRRWSGTVFKVSRGECSFIWIIVLRGMSKIDIGKGKITSYTWRGLVGDVKAAVSLWIVFFFFAWLTRYPTSYCVMRPLGSTGSSHLRKIMSSSGVKVRDSGAMPPGTTAGEKNKPLWNKHSARVSS